MNTKVKLLSALIGTGIITATVTGFAARPWYPCSEPNPIPADDCGSCKDSRHMEGQNCVKNPPYCTTNTCTLYTEEVTWDEAQNVCPNGIATLEDLCPTSKGNFAGTDCSIPSDLVNKIGVGQKIWIGGYCEGSYYELVEGICTITDSRPSSNYNGVYIVNVGGDMIRLYSEPTSYSNRVLCR